MGYATSMLLALWPLVHPTAVEASLPASLTRQIVAHYDIGRGTLDFGGVSEVRSFALSMPGGVHGQEFVARALEALMPLVDTGHPADLAATCGVDVDAGTFEPIASVAACAAWHAAAATDGAPRVARALATMARVGQGDEAEAETYRDALDELRRYLAFDAHDYVEVLATAGHDGGDAHTAILIDEARRMAHLVRYDW